MCPMGGTIQPLDTAFMVPVVGPFSLFLFFMVPVVGPYGFATGTMRTCGGTVF